MFSVPASFPIQCVDGVWKIPFHAGAPLQPVDPECMTTLAKNAAAYLRVDPSFGPWRKAQANLEAAQAKVHELEQRRKDLQAARQVEADVEEEDFLVRNLAAERQVAQELEVAMQALEAIREIHTRRESTVHREAKKIASKCLAEFRAAHALHAEDLCRRLSDQAGDLVGQLVETTRKINYTLQDMTVVNASITNRILKA